MTRERRYAAGTTVSAEQSRAELEVLLARYGADRFAYQWDGDHRVVGFRLDQKVIRITLALPGPDDYHVRYTPEGRQRAPASQRVFRSQLIREKWRALLLITKAKLEAVASGISTLDDEYLAQMILPGGHTVGEWVRPQVESAYALGELPALLPAGTAR